MYELISFRRNTEYQLVFLGFQSEDDFAFICAPLLLTHTIQIYYSCSSQYFYQFHNDLHYVYITRFRCPPHQIDYIQESTVSVANARLIKSPILTQKALDFIQVLFPVGTNEGLRSLQPYRRYKCTNL